MKVIAALAAGLLIGLAGTANAQTVLDPQFTQPFGSPWTATGPAIVVPDTAAPTGLLPPPFLSTVADVIGGRAGIADVSQTISGMILGDEYSVGFWFAVSSPGSLTNKFGVNFENVSGTPALPGFQVNATSTSDFVYETFMVTANGSNTLSFYSQNPAGIDFYFGGVSVTLVPEPATLAVLATGMIGLGLIRRRRA